MFLPASSFSGSPAQQTPGAFGPAPALTQIPQMPLTAGVGSGNGNGMSGSKMALIQALLGQAAGGMGGGQGGLGSMQGPLLGMLAQRKFGLGG